MGVSREMNLERDPEEYVEENTEQLSYVITHSNDRFVRGLCLAALVKYGSDADVDQVKQELNQFEKQES